MGRNTSARSATPSSIAIGASQSIRILSRISLVISVMVVAVDSAVPGKGFKRPAQEFARRFRAVDQPQRTPFDLPPGGRADQIPAIGHHAVDVIATRSAMVGHFDRLAGFFRREDLQVGNDYGLVAIDRDMRQAGEMGKAAGNSGPMAGALEVCPNRLVAGGAGQAGPAVENAVFGIDGFGIGRGAGIGARRMAGDKIVDFEAILESAYALFQVQMLLGHNWSPNCDSRRGSGRLSALG